MRLALVTGSRSEWRLVEPLLRAANASNDTQPLLFVTGTHLSTRHGRTVTQIRAAGWEPAACIDILEAEDTPLAVARATARAVDGFAEALVRHAPDWVVVSGDRYESFAAAVAVTMVGIPLAHVAGGETDVATNQDCNLRNAMTKLAQAHFVAHELARERVLALGEEPWRVCISGLPSLDRIETQCAARSDLARAELVPEDRRFVLVSYLPVTLRAAESLAQLDVLLAALAQVPEFHKLVILSNADAGGHEHDCRIAAWAADRTDVTSVAALEPALYLAALRHCACFVGNSSSGVIESPVFGTPVVIVGARQDGRPRADNVLDVADPTVSTLVAALKAQLAGGRYASGCSPFGDGCAAERICRELRALRSRPDLMTKRVVVPELIA
ncbi:MAG: UDP-N-acetylglucosamine 2-epimerase (hydrolyzing) [Planctomycetes bacterium]|nr:UDP-N-acetylglucosamine 2-epimerase (hydrolyzing) [Planctomycetota bacterium]